jgi:hypothetical protein
MIACHTWDTLGAVAAGWQAALIKRVGNDVLDARSRRSSATTSTMSRISSSPGTKDAPSASVRTHARGARLAKLV